MEHKKPSILLVDDEPDILFSLRGLLRHDFDVQAVESGAEALQVLAQQRVQVIMTDQRMPGMTGAELLSRSREVCPDAVSIIFTGYADIKAVVDAVNHGHIFRYITKPWDPDDLLGVLNEAVAHYERTADRQRLLVDLQGFVAESVALLDGASDRPAAIEHSRSDAWEQLAQRGQALLQRLNRSVSP